MPLEWTALSILFVRTVYVIHVFFIHTHWCIQVFVANLLQRSLKLEVKEIKRKKEVKTERKKRREKEKKTEKRRDKKRKGKNL